MNFQSVTDVSDLDILLVNSEKFNQVFIQKIKPAWQNRILNRLVQSPVHFNKLVEILVDMVVSQKHPEWVKRALKWLTKIFEHPELSIMLRTCQPSLLRFLSFSADTFGVCSLLNSAMGVTTNAPKPKPRKSSSGTQIIDTHYVFVDDSDENFGLSAKRRRKQALGECTDTGSDEETPLSLGSSDGMDYDEEDGSDDEDVEAASEDDGVFDVDNGSLSSFPESISSLPPHSATTRSRNSDEELSDEAEYDEADEDSSEEGSDVDYGEDGPSGLPDDESEEEEEEVQQDDVEDYDDKEGGDNSNEVSINNRGSLIPRSIPPRTSSSSSRPSRRK